MHFLQNVETVILKTAVERQRRGFIPAWGKRSVAPGQVSLFFIRAEGPDYEKEDKDLDSTGFQP